MARRRYISTDISKDAAVKKLAASNGAFAALLYTWMIPHATDDGGITSDPEELQLLVVPGIKVKTAQIADAVESMLALELLTRENSKLYFPPASFYKHQSYISEKNRRSEDCRESPRIAEERRESPKNAASPPPSPSFSPSPSLSVVGVDARAKDEIGEVVAEFATYGTVNELTAGYVEEAIATYTLDWTRRAVKVGAKGKAGADHPPWNYVEKTLKRWQARGAPDDDESSNTGRSKPGAPADPDGVATGVRGMEQRESSLVEQRRHRTV